MNSDNKGFWQKYAKYYSSFMKSSEVLYKKIAMQIIPQLNGRMKVLELACGSGQLTYKLLRYCGRYIATDYSENMVNEAKKRGVCRKLSYEVQDATAISYPDNSFNAVLISNALHIMPDPEKALSEIHRVLEDDGLLFAPTFVHAENTMFKVRFFVLNKLGFKVYSRWTSDEYESFIKENGFEIKNRVDFEDKLMPLCLIIAKKREIVSDLPKEQ